jgi:hypothetical protein
MQEEQSKLHAEFVFSSLGYSVAHIPVEENERRADLAVTQGSENIFVEAKSKSQNSRYCKLMEDSKSNGIARMTREVGDSGAISAVIKDGAEQLAKTCCDDESFQILFVSCLHNDWEFVFDEFKNRAYGLAEFVVLPKSLTSLNATYHVECFYFWSADFIRFKNLNGIVLACSDGEFLFVNEFSVNVARFRCSNLYEKMSSIKCVLDPLRSYELSGALRLDDCLLRTQKERHAHLSEKYGLRLSPSNVLLFNALMHVEVGIVSQ